MHSIRLPEQCLDREQANTAFKGLQNIDTLRLDYRSTLFTGHSFTDELAQCIMKLNPTHLEVIGGDNSMHDMLRKYLDKPFTVVKPFYH